MRIVFHKPLPPVLDLMYIEKGRKRERQPCLELLLGGAYAFACHPCHPQKKILGLDVYEQTSLSYDCLLVQLALYFTRERNDDDDKAGKLHLVKSAKGFTIGTNNFHVA